MPGIQFKLRMGLLLPLVLLLVVPAFSQDTAATTGRALDPTGAVVVGDQVTAVNIATNIEDKTQRSNDEGMYRFMLGIPETERRVHLRRDLPARKAPAQRVTSGDLTVQGFAAARRDHF